ncbi:arsenate reductase (azurin) large subunit [Paracoccus saliphilus]|uniref:Arsenate reductase (Azurin) large subunit n=1 Tax=Paracoccus saliphilus TaxID=405559 RepID=A0AA45W7Y5_9RHOB|nr:arsenate reductase (azurin) large subunit [Paracoccus saliphilus]WCR04825.1 arsenate reductase (azurin) large subunit [Paracoccus saliphilus]SIT13031.1 arsenite oxidase large subunit [Paracoccus saliphilus]
MAYKRHIDRLPIIPADAKVQNAVCHYCIVGCGYKAYTWPINRQGGTDPSQNVFGVDLSEQQPQDTEAWYAPSMYNIVKQDGRDVQLVIKPDVNCVVNSGLGSVRGARMAENHPSTVTGTQGHRLTDPLTWRYGTYQQTSWEDAFDLVARVTARIVTDGSEDDLIVSMFDHGGSGGGYENTWGTGKLYFESMKVKNVRIHNRPAYNSEVHATRDMGVGELNNAYEDAELTDTLVAWGCNPLECQTNYFLNHWVPNLQGITSDKKAELLPDEPHEPAKIIFIDPRRNVSVNAAEQAAGTDNVLHLPINSGTDLALANAIFTHIVEQGWHDQDFIDAHTLREAAEHPAEFPAKGASDANPGLLTSFEDAVETNRMSLEEAAEICGVPADDIRKAAEWMAEPKEGGARRRMMIGYEKGIIWGNDNYRTNGAIVNISLATRNIGHLGGGCVRMGGHQEGYFRPSEGHVGRPAAYVDQLIIDGKGGVHHIWACNHYRTTLNATEFKRIYNHRTNMVKEAMDSVAGQGRDALVDAIVGAIAEGGLFAVNVDIIQNEMGSQAHVVLPAAQQGEMNLTSMNGERRMRLAEKYMDPPGHAMPDCLIAAGIAQHMERVLSEAGNSDYAANFQGYDWKNEEDAFRDGYQSAHPDVTYERLRGMGTNGFQEPPQGLDGETIIGTDRLYKDGKFSTDDGLARFMAGPWRGLVTPGKQEESESYTFLINNGRSNLNWQNWFLDQENDFVTDRWPYPFIEMNPEDMAENGIEPGDLVEVFNGNGATQAIAYPTETATRGETFMLFGSPRGTQGNIVSKGVNELVIPVYKQTWADIRKIADVPEAARHISFKSKEFRF